MQPTPSILTRAAGRGLLGLAALVLAGMGIALPSVAASTDISSEPLITQTAITAKPNLMFILDGSGSMASAYMPDEMSSSSRYGYRTSQCNGVGYDPTYNYTPPVTYTGASYSNSSYANAWDDGYDQSSTTDLSGVSSTTVSFTTISSSVAVGSGSKTFSFSSSSLSSNSFLVGVSAQASGSSSRQMTGLVTAWTNTSGNNWTLTINVTSTNGSGSTSSYAVTQTQPVSDYYFIYTGSQTAMDWTYNSDGSVNTSTTFYSECQSSVGNTPGSGVFTKVLLSSLTTTQQQNYANWYSYYRKRYLLMRTAVGQAFTALDSGYRVGFTTIGDTGVTDDGATLSGSTSYFRDVKDFDSTQKQRFYLSLYSVAPSTATPLRAALSKVGRYYAKKATSGQSYDPMVYSCQRNYALLSTDGYWNGNAGYQLDGSAIGNQDGSEVRPMSDGAASATIYSRSNYTVGNSTSNSSNGSCSSGYYLVTIQPQTRIGTGGSWANNGSSSPSCALPTDVVVNGNTAQTLRNTTTAGPITSTQGTTGGTSNTLADVAEYYYNTDLRTSALGNCTSSTSGASRDVCANTVPTTTQDTNAFQHMNTFTIGLGVNGTLPYDPNYLTQTSGSYVNLTNGSVNWPTPTESSNGGDATDVDDLWHAAVNGRGVYYSARTASALGQAISGVVNAVREVAGGGSGGASSASKLDSNNSNQRFQATYHTVSWTGEVSAYPVDGTTGAIGSTANWTAQAQLDRVTPASRKIYYRKSSTDATLRAFNYTNLNADSLGGNFTNFCTKTIVPSQCAGMTSTNQTIANNGTALVDFLTGVRTYESTNLTSPLFRTRSHVLGDIINSAPVYVGKSPFAYSDAGYSTFAASVASRTPVVYAGSNDGMLHAFNANTGAEMWAYVPMAVMANMYKLANTGYSSGHQYFVDGAPVVNDIKVGSTWKTILVAGLGGGGNSYYALDITDPANPVSLWEFTETNMGLTYGNPIIGKRADGTWIVAFSSGYNNNTNGGDGKGHLYVVNANTGAQILNIVTTAGSTTTPSGLGRIEGWVDSYTDDTIKRIYGGDLLGNLWRFDIDNLVAPNQGAMLLAQLQTSGGAVQPVTIKPQLALASSLYPVVAIATGRYIGVSDITDTTVQSVYTIKDPLTATGWGVVRNNVTMVQQTITANDTSHTATITANNMPWSTKNGWWVDLPHSGERVTVDMLLINGQLTVPTAIPSGDACTSGGSSWAYGINLNTGSNPATTVGYQVSASAIVVGLDKVTTSDGTVKQAISTSDGAPSSNISVGGSTGGGNGGGTSIIDTPRRTTWRELTN